MTGEVLAENVGHQQRVRRELMPRYCASSPPSHIANLLSPFHFSTSTEAHRKRDRSYENVGFTQGSRDVFCITIRDPSVPQSGNEVMTRFSRLFVFATTASLASAGSGLADESYGPFKMMQTSIGEVLTTADGMTLYTFDKDEAGTSNCTGECAEYWTPAAALTDAKPIDDDLTLIKRTDGTLQWANEGKPLYTYANDKKPGDVTGDGMNGVWHVVRDD